MRELFTFIREHKVAMFYGGKASTGNTDEIITEIETITIKMMKMPITVIIMRIEFYSVTTITITMTMARKQ